MTPSQIEPIIKNLKAAKENIVKVEPKTAEEILMVADLEATIKDLEENGIKDPSELIEILTKMEAVVVAAMRTR